MLRGGRARTLPRYLCMNSRHISGVFSPHPTLDLRWMPKLLWGPTNNSFFPKMQSRAERVGRTGEVRGERSVTDAVCGRCASCGIVGGTIMRGEVRGGTA